MYCPKCHKLNNCGCESCKESRRLRGESLLMEKETNFDEFGFILIFGEYFKKHPSDMSKKDWVSIKRNFIIKDILKK